MLPQWRLDAILRERQNIADEFGEEEETFEVSMPLKHASCVVESGKFQLT